MSHEPQPTTTVRERVDDLTAVDERAPAPAG